ncbi:MAG: protein kinase [Myxococcales bacterium]|nr:protein kinase [Myxococcales bacterium]
MSSTKTAPPSGLEEKTVIDRPRGGGVGDTMPLAPRTGAPPALRAAPDNLRLFEPIGRGGMGEVYRAEQVELARKVAFKQLLETSSEQQRERFAREARLTAQLDHPNIVPIHTLERTKDGSTTGYVMKLVEGKTLRALLNETADAYERGARIDVEHALTTRLEHFLKICDAVAFAHSKGVIHRDLKPANVMIGRFGEVYLMDWGVARQVDVPDDLAVDRRSRVVHDDPTITQAGEVVGSASYMSPEQAEGRNADVDTRSDQYALGLILFEIVTLRRALEAGTLDELFVAASRGEKAPFEHVSKRERVPADIRAIVEKATAYAPGDRYPSVAALAEDVRRFLTGDEISARPDGPLGRVLRWMGRHRKKTLVAVAAVVALSGLVVSWSLYQKTKGELAARERGERVNDVYVDAAAQAHRIDAQFQRMEAALEGLRTAAQWALEGPEPPPDLRVYYAADFTDPAKRPADFGAGTKYRWPVSLEHPVVGLAPGLDQAALHSKIRRLAPLRHHIRQMIAAAASDTREVPSPDEIGRILAERRSPIDYAYVDLAEGVHYVYPGIDALPPGYDVRTSSFYTMSANKRGRRWGRPYVDATTDEQGDDLVLPCTEGLWSSTGEFLGVVGVEITVTKLVETSLALPDRETIRVTLVDEQGRKVVDSGDAGRRFRANGKDEFIELAPFDIPEVVEAVKAGDEGVREVRRDGRREVVAFARLGVLGWTYVVEVDAASVDPR